MAFEHKERIVQEYVPGRQVTMAHIRAIRAKDPVIITYPPTLWIITQIMSPPSQSNRSMYR